MRDPAKSIAAAIGTVRTLVHGFPTTDARVTDEMKDFWDNASRSAICTWKLAELADTGEGCASGIEKLPGLKDDAEAACATWADLYALDWAENFPTPPYQNCPGMRTAAARPSIPSCWCPAQ